MPIHDLKCSKCGTINLNVIVHYNDLDDGKASYPKCANCNGTPLDVWYGEWQDVGLEDHGRSRNERVDANGFIKNFGVADCSLSQLELGVVRKPSDASLKTFSPEQSEAFRLRTLVDGDSPKLRREILETREANIRERQKRR